MYLRLTALIIVFLLLAGNFSPNRFVGYPFLLLISLPIAYIYHMMKGRYAFYVLFFLSALLLGNIVLRDSLLLGFVSLGYLLPYLSLAHMYKMGLKDLIFRKTKIRQALAREYQNLIEKYDRVKDLDQELTLKSVEIIDMYEIAKKMSLSIKLSGSMEILKQYLHDNFYFKECTILFIHEIGGRCVIDKVFRIAKDSSRIRSSEPSFVTNPEDITKATQADEEIVKSSLKERKPLFVTKNQPNAAAAGILSGKKIQSLFSIPSFIGEKLNYLMYIENIKSGQRGKFQILIDQCVLEMEKVKLYEQVEKLAITDSLTGLYVKSHFMELATGEINRIKQNGLSLACLMLDMDLFKECNDSYGHLMGDAVLKNTAEIIKKNTRELDVVTRYGGEEFLMLLPETDTEGAINVAERIRLGVESFEFRAFNQTSRNTISVGVATYPGNGETLEEMIENSDRALYKAKMQGRNRICIYKS